METEYSPEFIDVKGVPRQNRERNDSKWKLRFEQLEVGKAALLTFNNRQRAHQVAIRIRGAATYWKVPISIRVIHAEPAIHDGNEGWFLYFWKKEE